MLKVVIDTNVFISGLVKSPSCRRVINALEKGRFILVISPEILAEIIGVIARPKFHKIINKKTAAALMEVIKIQSLMVRPSLRINEIKVDTDDNRFLEAALTAKVDGIISLDKHLLSLGSFRNISIITPTRFLQLLKKSLL